MTSVLPEEESNVTRLKQKSQTHGTHMGKPAADESRSFLTFSRENLSISNSDLEQGFSSRSSGFHFPRCCSRQTLLSCAALILALSCAALELWKLRRVLANSQDLETLRRDVEGLKHRFLEKDLLEELKAFEEQLYGEGGSDEDEPSSANGLVSSDYDASYDESSSSSSGASGDYQPSVLTYVASTPSSASSSSPSSSTRLVPRTSFTTTTQQTTPCTSKELEDVLAVLRRAEAERGQAFEHSVARERKRLLEEEREREQRRIAVQHRQDERPVAKREVGVEVEDFYTRLKHLSTE